MQHRIKRITTSVLLNLFLLFLAFLFLFPFLWMLSNSLKLEVDMYNFPIQWIPDPPQFNNYRKIWEMVPFGLYFWNSFKLSTLITIGQLFTSALAGYGFAKIKFRGSNKIFMGYLATMMVPFQVIMVPQYLLFSKMGIINSHEALIWPGIFSVFGVFMLRQFFMSIPDEMLEAARIDGSGEFRTFLAVVLPNAKAAIASLAIFSFRWFWNDFLAPLIYLNSTSLRTVPLGLSSLQAEYQSFMTLIMAASMVALLPAIIVFIICQRYLVQGIVMSGLKG